VLSDVARACGRDRPLLGQSTLQLYVVSPHMATNMAVLDPRIRWLDPVWTYGKPSLHMLSLSVGFSLIIHTRHRKASPGGMKLRDMRGQRI
jgi:hypothetical protein